MSIQNAQLQYCEIGKDRAILQQQQLFSRYASPLAIEITGQPKPPARQLLRMVSGREQDISCKKTEIFALDSWIAQDSLPLQKTVTCQYHIFLFQLRDDANRWIAAGFAKAGRMVCITP